MNVLDENIPAPERDLLSEWRIPFRRIGDGVGRYGMKDQDEIIPLLHSLRAPTFFTRDADFYRLHLCHNSYCLVYLDVLIDETATYIHRFLRHRSFRTKTQRLGKVVRLRHTGTSFFQAHDAQEHNLLW